MKLGLPQMRLKTLYLALNAISVGSFLVLLYFSNELLTHFRAFAGFEQSFMIVTSDIDEMRRAPDKLSLHSVADALLEHIPQRLAPFEQQRLINATRQIKAKTELPDSLAGIDNLVFEVTSLRIKYQKRFEERVAFVSTLLLRVAILVIVAIIAMFFYGERVSKAEEYMEKQRAAVAHSSRMTAIGEMAGGISHEINNPLGFIMGYTEQVETLIQKSPPNLEKILSKTSIIKETCERIAKIVRGLKTMSRDGSEDPFSPISIKKIVNDIVSLSEHTLKRHAIDLQMDSEIADLYISGRETQIGQVLLNLLSNAREAVEGLPEKWVRLGVRELEDKVEISITDSGSGIPKEIQEKIMLPFFTTKREGVGTGLGLSISLGIISAHKGKFFLDNECPNTRFVIQFPKVIKTKMENSKAA